MRMLSLPAELELERDLPFAPPKNLPPRHPLDKLAEFIRSMSYGDVKELGMGLAELAVPMPKGSAIQLADLVYCWANKRFEQRMVNLKSLEDALQEELGCEPIWHR